MSTPLNMNDVHRCFANMCHVKTGAYVIALIQTIFMAGNMIFEILPGNSVLWIFGVPMGITGWLCALLLVIGVAMKQKWMLMPEIVYLVLVAFGSFIAAIAIIITLIIEASSLYYRDVEKTLGIDSQIVYGRHLKVRWISLGLLVYAALAVWFFRIVRLTYDYLSCLGIHQRHGGLPKIFETLRRGNNKGAGNGGPLNCTGNVTNITVHGPVQSDAKSGGGLPPPYPIYPNIPSAQSSSSDHPQYYV